jgi:hypothetical protein
MEGHLTEEEKKSLFHTREYFDAETRKIMMARNVHVAITKVVDISL